MRILHKSLGTHMLPLRLFVALFSIVSILSIGGVNSATVSARTRSLAYSLHDVVLVGNSVSGTVSFLDGQTFSNLGSFNVIPDLQQRLDQMTVDEKIGYALVKQQEGGDRFVDDMAVSPDGQTLYVSRANLADLVAFNLVTHQMLWRFKVAGIHADHMALSPDGTQLVISATTAQEAQVIDPQTGTLIGTFPTGTYPHQNDYSADGKYIYNDSIGIITFPQALEALKGPRLLTVVDAKTLKVVRTYSFEHGIRPSVITPDGKTMYADLSYLNGFIEFDLTTGTITHTVNMPFSAAAQALSPDSYPLNSAHHGMAMSGDGSKLCDVGTIDNYVAIISRPALTTDKIINVGNMPYWATTSRDGNYCLVSNSKDNDVSVISYSSAQEITRVPVGSFPQRERLGTVTDAVISGLSSSAG
jgi:YVTN family beta-propeller protein